MTSYPDAVMNVWMMISIFALAFSNLSPAYADEAGHAWLENIDQTAQVNNAHLVLKITVTDARGENRGSTTRYLATGR